MSNLILIAPVCRYALFVLIIFFSAISNAQNTSILRGFLTDSLSGETLPYGNIIIKELNNGTATDNRGYFLFPALPAPALYTVSVSYVGYKNKKLEAVVKPNQSTLLNIQLIPVTFELQTVEKVAQRIDGDKNPDISVHTILIKELETIPQGVETDILRSIQNVPGVTITSDVSAKYYVRGGSNNQNLFLLNDATIYNPFHALGMFSAVDPTMINSIEFYKGGFPTEYSGRISSVMNLITKYGNKNRFSGLVSASLLTTKGAFEGPIPNGSFIITGRKSVSNRVLKNFYNDKNVPVDFYDLSFNINYANNRVVKGARFIFHGFFSDDRIINNNIRKADYIWKNGVYGFTYYQVLDSPLFYRMSLNFSTFNGEVNPNLGNIKYKKNQLTDYTFEADFTYVYSNSDILDAGLRVSEIETNLHLQNSFGERINIHSGEAKDNWSIYAKYQFNSFENFGLEIGTRINIVSLIKGEETYNPLEPRIRLSYNISPHIKVKAAAGIFLQQLTTLSDEDEVISIFEPWIILPDYIGTTKSIHYTAGIDLNLNGNWSFGAEGYYKKTSKLPLLNKDKIFPSDPDLVSGRSEAYGTELTNRLFTRDINFVTSYSLAWVINEVGGIRYKPRYDIRNSLNLSLELNLGSGWSVSSLWTYKSGIPFTRLIGYYDKFYFQDNPNEYSILDMYSRFTLLDEKNTGRAPTYHRLDINVSKRFEFTFMKLFTGLSILNVYDRKNLFYFDLETGEQVNMLPFLPSVFIKAEF